MRMTRKSSEKGINNYFEKPQKLPLKKKERFLSAF